MHDNQGSQNTDRDSSGDNQGHAQMAQEEVEDKLDNVTNAQFGSYVELIKINKFNYKNPRKQ